MGNKVNNNINWLVDDFGNLVGYQPRPGVEVGLVTSKTNDVTGVVELSTGPAMGPRKTPVRVGMFGDSTADVFIDTIQDEGVLTAPFPASGSTTLGLYQEKFMLGSLYPQAYIVAACGISGQTTTQMLARDSAVYSAGRKSITDLLALNPDVIIYRGGSINDLAGVNASNWQATADATFANQKVILSRMLTGGMPILVQGIYGYGDGSAATSIYADSVRAALQYLNGLTQAYCATLPGDLFYLDPIAAGIQAPDGRYISGVSWDGIHQNMTGALLTAAAERVVLTSLFGPSGATRYPGNNLVANSLFALTGAQSYGTVATGMTIYSANCTLSEGKVEAVNGVAYQTVRGDFTAAANYILFSLTCPIATAGIVIGDVFGFEFDYFIEPLDGLQFQPTATFVAKIYIQKTASGFVLNATKVTHPGIINARAFGKMALQPLQITEPSANIVLNAFSLTVPSDHTSGAIKVGVSNPRMVKLSAAVATT